MGGVIGPQGRSNPQVCPWASQPPQGTHHPSKNQARRAPGEKKASYQARVFFSTMSGRRYCGGRADSPCTGIDMLHSTWIWDLPHSPWYLEQVLDKHLLKETARQETWAWVITLPLISCAPWSLAWPCPHFFVKRVRRAGKGHF